MLDNQFGVKISMEGDIPVSTSVLKIFDINTFYM